MKTIIKIKTTGEIIKIENNSQLQANINYELWKRKISNQDYELL